MLTAVSASTNQESPIYIAPHPHTINPLEPLTPPAQAMLRSVNSRKENTLPAFHAVSSGCVTRVITNNASIYDELIGEIAKEVRTARHSLLLQTYILESNSAAAEELFSAVAQRQKTMSNFRCVMVYNSLASSKAEAIAHAAEKAGAAITFVPYYQGFSRRSLHSKNAIIDGQKAFIGGSNIDNPQETDLALELRGAVVKGLLIEFLGLIRECKKSSSIFSTGIKSSMAPCSSTIMNHVENIVFSTEPVGPSCEGDTPMLIMGKPGTHWRGRYYNQLSDDAILRAIAAAQKEVCIRSPNVNDICLLNALCKSVERGVTVKILLPKGYQDMNSFLDSAANYAPLIFKAQRVPKHLQHLFQIKWASEDGKTPVAAHAKLFAVDGILIVGSQNADNQSFCFSRELNIALLSKKVGEEVLNKAFAPQWELGIPTTLRALHRILPIPQSSWQRRIGRITRIPLLIYKNISTHWNELFG